MNIYPLDRHRKHGESCPFPVFGIDQLNNGIIDRYPDITDDKLTEIVEYIAVHKKD